MKNFNLPWASGTKYWICIALSEGENSSAIDAKYSKKGKLLEGNIYVIEAPKKWAASWKDIKKTLKTANYDRPQAAVIPNDGGDVNYDKIYDQLKSVDEWDNIAENMWLAEAMLEDRLTCHFQPIFDRNNQAFGVESFVRVEEKNGETIGGGKIIEACYQLRIHHIIDKHLQVKAIEKFAECKVPGSLFINFITGFIQLPSKYLEKLSEATQEHDVMPKRIVLDVSKSDHVEDVSQVASVVDFCNSKGYSVALDDVKSLEQLSEILNETKPDFVKIDRGLTYNFEKPLIKDKIQKLIEYSHSKGCMVLAEGIEDKKTYDYLKDAGIDLFQGYYLAKPMPAEEINRALKKVG
ncbi:MAG: hypothetical protein COV36_06160 [Alphaproteobacteria bacterium CG11_big_fil_rev_8_21_14_0_20_44_7]|nr:MAG: hypothetical protein COV36_06160 [Alphaproteobacteria bacterium CG11_big_fil_rev_8_21_14_0_20_44_7]